MSGDLLKRIQTGMSGFSKGQRLIAEYISEHYDKAAYMTAARLGADVKVSESTVVRFAIELGYDGYPGLQRALQEMIRTKLTSVQRIEVANTRMTDEEVLDKVLLSDMDKIKRTIEAVDRAHFDSAVDAIVSARNIYIVGVRSCAPLASFMHFYLNVIFENVRLIDSAGPSEMFEQLIHIGEGDVMIAISFPRYSQRIISGVDFARAKGARVIALTDSESSPIAERANDVLIAKSDMASFVDSLVAPLSIINAMIAAIGRKKQDYVENAFSKLEDVWEEYGVYAKEREDDPDGK
ncbi:MAG: MurR/RpiR family transcriptional regulator [Clostridia bacterium]|nr:MurR/RpiR family transcriptional regulator [Clostridia bacterium]